jgi:hypothetical protein
VYGFDDLARLTVDRRRRRRAALADCGELALEIRLPCRQ